ncbi:MAG: hypothetical protein SFW65_03890 [Alphaproteobacteria bacterium]|nr:hypothetical protein [Alphaproteobacteria bacterium]
MKRTPVKTNPLHFDTFGSLNHVLESIDRMVPIIFKGEDLSFIPTLKTTIRLHAIQHKWDVIVLSLSKGMARQELDIILNHMPEHEGPLIVDATASTPEHEVVYNEALLLARKERILRLNDETGDIMVILYGIDGIDPPMERKLLMRRMHYMGTTLDMLLERNEDVEGGANEEGFTGALQRALSHIRSIYQHDKSEEAIAQSERTSSAAFMALSSLILAYEFTQADYLKERLSIIINNFKELPEIFKGADLNYDPYVKAANELQNKQPELENKQPELQNKQPEARRPDNQLQNRPEIPDLLENNHSAVDSLQNTPGALNELLNNAQAMNNLANTPNSVVLQNNPIIKEKVEAEHKRHTHHYDQLGPKMEPN